MTPFGGKGGHERDGDARSRPTWCLIRMGRVVSKGRETACPRDVGERPPGGGRAGTGVADAPAGAEDSEAHRVAPDWSENRPFVTVPLTGEVEPPGARSGLSARFVIVRERRSRGVVMPARPPGCCRSSRRPGRRRQSPGLR